MDVKSSIVIAKRSSFVRREIGLIVNNSELSGILIVDKPKGITSHDVVNMVRRSFKIKKVGHAGTLDPIATGVLVILIGKATKRSNSLACEDKEYAATLRLGVTTDTGDSTGKALSVKSTDELLSADVEKTIMSFKGETEQVPPMYSAVKFKGKNLYQWARKGIEVPRQARRINIKEICIQNISLPEVTFLMSCSKGTYVRQLCADIGARLGCGGHMAELRRTRSGAYDISQAVTVDRLKAIASEELPGLLL